MPQKIDMIGKKFGRLTVLAQDMERSKEACDTFYICRCDCGNIKSIRGFYIRHGKTTSCGCFRKEKLVKMSKETNSTHGKSKTRLYKIWSSMLGRCRNKNHPAYKNYGGRGIHVCAEWHEFLPFEKWAFDNGYDPSAKRGECTIDRIDTNGDYEPSNCRWTDIASQERNRRNVRKIRCTNGKIYESQTQAADEFGVKQSCIWYAMKQCKPINGFYFERI